MPKLDALDLANELDSTWHGQAKSFEREAVTRLWGLLTLPARVLDPERPRELLRSASILRNARFQGSAVKDMFFGNKTFTEVDALFLQVGSSLGHTRGEDAWVVEVERKEANQQHDYFSAIQRARKFADLFANAFGVRALPVVIFEDDAGKLSYQRFDGDVLVVPMSTLRDGTRGLSFPSLSDLPGLGSDKTLVKMALLRQLATVDPNRPGWYGGPLALAREVATKGWPLHHLVVGHQNTETLPDTLDKWLHREKEPEGHLSARIDRYLDEMDEAGLLERRQPSPSLSKLGGQIALRILSAEHQELR